MLTVAGCCPVPADLKVSIALREFIEVVARTPKRIGSKIGRLLIGPPKNYPDVDTTSCSTLEHIQCPTATVRHLEGRPHKGHRNPHAMPGSLDRLANSTEGRLSIDPEPSPIAPPRWIGAGVNEG